jgi:hypothetical protein
LEGGSDAAGVLMDSSTLDTEALCRYIAGVLPSSAGTGIDLVFGGIVDYSKIKPAILLRGLVRI